MILRKLSFAMLAAIATAVTTTNVKADHNHNLLQAKSEAIRVTMTDLDYTLVRSYVRSRVFGEIMATSGQIKGKSVHLRVMARYGSACDWKYEIEQLDRLVCKLDALLEEAHYRARRGLDPPILTCTDTVARSVVAMKELVRCMREALESPVFVEPAPPQYAPPTAPSVEYHDRGGARQAGFHHKLKHHYRHAGHGFYKPLTYGSRYGFGPVRVQPGRGGVRLGTDRFAFHFDF